jgi:hypothetical protein
MNKTIIVLFIIILLASSTASVLACEPTATPITFTQDPPHKHTPTPTDHRGVVTIVYVTDEPTATNPPRKHKTPVPPVYRTATPNTCMSDCEFKRLVIQLLMQILAEIRK